VSVPDETSGPVPENEGAAPFTEVRYSMPELLREVQRDRTSRAFAMEKLDQPAITSLFEQQQQARRDRDKKQ
jgi:hypothetical protein